MMKNLLLALLALSPLSAIAQQNDWSPILACESGTMVVDQSGNGDTFQLVIRNSPDILRYFSTKTDITRAVNDKGELIGSLSAVGPRQEVPSSLYVGYISGQTNVVVSRDANGQIRVGLWEVGYRGTHSEEVANWVFKGCR
jgi:hypothetical protein